MSWQLKHLTNTPTTPNLQKAQIGLDSLHDVPLAGCVGVSITMGFRLRFAIFTIGTYFIALGIWLLSQDFPSISALVMLPGIAFLLLLLPVPPVFAIFALLVEIGGPVPEEDQADWKYQYKLFKWWILGALVFPASLVTLAISQRYNSFLGDFEAILILPLPAFGIASLILSIKSLYKAAKYKYFSSKGANEIQQ